MKLARTSRYNYAPLYRDDGVEFFGTRPAIRLPPHASDKFHVVTEADYIRIDLIAWKYYQDVSLWWVIADVNDITNPLELQIGMTLRIPALRRVLMKVVQ